MEDRDVVSPWSAGMASLLLPGSGQWLNGERPKAVAVACAAAGVWGGVALSLFGPAPVRSVLTAILLAAVYPFLWLPAVVDAVQVARGRPTRTLSGDRPLYVLFLLVTVGPMAVPLLWQSPRFSRRAKVALTAVVVAIALLGVAIALWFGPVVEAKIMELLGSMG